MAHTQRVRTCLTDSLQAPLKGYSWDPPFLVCLPNSSKTPWVPEHHFKNNLERAPFCILNAINWEFLVENVIFQKVMLV